MTWPTPFVCPGKRRSLGMASHGHFDRSRHGCCVAASPRNFSSFGRRFKPMVVFYNPKVTRPPNRRFPLSILSLAAMLEGREEYAIVDGNLDPHPQDTLAALMRE